MVRPRGGGFCYDEQDVSIMMDEAKLLLENGADGIAFGFWKMMEVSQSKKQKLW